MGNRDELPTDGRIAGEYETRYKDKRCQKKIKRDAIYLTFLLLGSTVLMLFNSLGMLENIFALEGSQAIIFRKVAYCVIAGLLGGATFGMKYFYRVVARGLWNEDRVYWRFFSPLVAIPLSIVMAAIMIRDVSSSSALAITIGFLTGYFSDEAVSKMYDIACVLFVKSESTNAKVDYVNAETQNEQDHDNV